MRKLFLLAAMVGLIGVGGEAQAIPVVTLEFLGAPSAPGPDGTTLQTLYIGQTVTVTLHLVNDSTVFAGTTSVGLDVGGVVNVTSATNTPPAPLGPVAFSLGAPGGPTGFFGGLALTGSVAPGTYNIGTVTYTAVGLGTVTLSTIYTSGIDDWYDLGYNNVTPSASSATINVIPIPEPATASMLGLGILGLVLLGRRPSSC